MKCENVLTSNVADLLWVTIQKMSLSDEDITTHREYLKSFFICIPSQKKSIPSAVSTDN
jgi:hypothetical protein